MSRSAAAALEALSARIAACEAKHGLTWTVWGAYDAQELAWQRDVEADFRREWRSRWGAALEALWLAGYSNGAERGIEDDLSDHSPVGRLWLRIQCTVAMLLGRRGFGDPDAGDRPFFEYPRHPLNNLVLVYWDNGSGVTGWSCQTLKFHPAQFRYDIDWDGEGWL